MSGGNLQGYEGYQGQLNDGVLGQGLKRASVVRGSTLEVPMFHDLHDLIPWDHWHQRNQLKSVDRPRDDRSTLETA